MYKIEKNTEMYKSKIEVVIVFFETNMGMLDGAESLPIVLEINVADIGTDSVDKY